MRRTKFRFIWFIIALVLLAVIFLRARQTNDKVLKSNLYKEWAQQFLVTKGDTAYIKTTNDETKDVVLSEAQGYGMLISVEAAEEGLASKSQFNHLYHYYLSHRDGSSQLMSWRQIISGQKETSQKSNETDGDLYIAYALIRAANLWNDEEYKKQAKRLLADILAYNYNSTQEVLTVGNWATKDSKYYNLVRTSDVLPEQFSSFYELSGDERWLTIKDNMLDKLTLVSQKVKTGLVPDFIWLEDDNVKIASSNDVANEFDGSYSYNACRLPYNLAHSKDAKSQQVLGKMMTFFMSKNHVYAGYDLAGHVLTKQNAGSFSAPLLYAGSQNTDYQKLVEENRYIFMTKLSEQSYYDATLVTLVALETL